MLLHLNWNTIESHFQHLRLQMFHKIVFNHVDVSLPGYVSYRARHTRSTAFKFIQIGSTVDAYKYSFFPSAIRLWDNLPEGIIICNDINTFKDSLNLITL